MTQISLELPLSLSPTGLLSAVLQRSFQSPWFFTQRHHDVTLVTALAH